MRTPAAGSAFAARSDGPCRRISGDEGTSLIELMVGMLLMAIFMGMFTGAVVMMNTAMNKSQAVNLTASQLNVAFHNLDEIVRYAAAISTPGVGKSGDWYVELRSTHTGTEICTQLRVDVPSRQLQQRTWPVVAWTPIASGISSDGAVSGPSSQPFYLNSPLPNSLHQQLTINLRSPSGSGSSLTASTSSYTFTAMNSIIPVPTAPICQQQGRP